MQEDRREHHPEGIHRPVRALPRQAATLQVPIPAKRARGNVAKFSTPSLSFSVPQRVSLCVRRHQRKEVLFALKRTRRGAASKTHKRNWWSNVKC